MPKSISRITPVHLRALSILGNESSIPESTAMNAIAYNPIPIPWTMAVVSHRCLPPLIVYRRTNDNEGPGDIAPNAQTRAKPAHSSGVIQAKPLQGI